MHTHAVDVYIHGYINTHVCAFVCMCASRDTVSGCGRGSVVLVSCSTYIKISVQGLVFVHIYMYRHIYTSTYAHVCVYLHIDA